MDGYRSKAATASSVGNSATARSCLSAYALNRAEELGRTDYEKRRWLPHQLAQFPSDFHDGLLDEYERLLSAGKPSAASDLFFDLRKQLRPEALNLAASDAEIVATADRHASYCAGLGGAGRAPSIVRMYARIYARSVSVEPPELAGKITTEVAYRKLCDALWWRRQLRAGIARAVERTAIRLGQVHRFQGLYVSDATLGRWRQQGSRNKRCLENLTATNEIGESFQLSELAERSVANPRCRRSELMARLAGFEAHARNHGHSARMYTITCPSRMHARLHKTGAPNSRYDLTDPSAAQKYLCDLWERARSSLQRQGVRIYGFRVAEPQHDGTPHWHLLLFVPENHVEAVGNTLRRYALESDPDEPGAAIHRLTEVVIDYSKGTATGYLAKYVSKNIDGEHLEGTDAGAASRAERTRAWASVWGIRQFQQIGNPIVSVWRELRRGVDDGRGLVEEAAAAATDGDWGTFTRLMGGPQTRRRNLPLYLLKARHRAFGRHGQQAEPVVIGVASADGEFRTRHHTWTVAPRSADRDTLEFCQ